MFELYPLESEQRTPEEVRDENRRLRKLYQQAYYDLCVQGKCYSCEYSKDELACNQFKPNFSRLGLVPCENYLWRGVVGKSMFYSQKQAVDKVAE